LSSYYYNTGSTDNPDYNSNIIRKQKDLLAEKQPTLTTTTTIAKQQQYKKKKKYKRHSSKVQQRIEWRRNKLSEYLIRGMSLPDISRIMNIPYKTLYEDHCFLRQQARENMKNHISDLPFNIKQATDGLNKLVSILYDIQDLEVIKAQGRKTSDHVRIMAIGLIKDCIKEKMDILTSQGAINHALDFIEKTNTQIKEEFNEEMQQVIEQDKVESAAISDAIEKNSEIIESDNSKATTADDNSFLPSSSTNLMTAELLEEEDCLEGTDVADQEDKEEQQTR
jgi:hypothetical protein